MKNPFLAILNNKCHLLKTSNDGLFAFEKAEGVLSHPNTKADIQKSLFSAEYDEKEECYLYETKRMYLLHRLDSPTSGILLCADNKALADILKKAFENRQIEKCYYAWVKGVVSHKSGIWKDILAKDKSAKGVRVQSSKGGFLAETKFECIKKIVFNNTMLSLLKLLPQTGRTHQLRIQCQLHHCQIIGDQTYGDFSFNRNFSKQTEINRLLLHANKVKIQYTFNNQSRKFEGESTLPPAFAFQKC